MNFYNVIFGGFLLLSLTVCRQAGFYFGLALSIKILTTQHAEVLIYIISLKMPEADKSKS